MSKELCDNVDCKGKYKQSDLKKVRMKAIFEGGVVLWCKNCRETDVNFIADDCVNCGKPVENDDIYDLFMNYIRDRLTDDEFWEWVRSWLDIEIIIDMARNWEVEDMAEQIELWKGQKKKGGKKK